MRLVNTTALHAVRLVIAGAVMLILALLVLTPASAQETPTPTPLADLTVTKIDSADPVVTGETFTYTVEVRNAGAVGAQFVRMIDTPPANFTYLGFTTTHGACVIGSTTGGTLDCDLGSLGTGPAAFATITITGRAKSPQVRSVLMDELADASHEVHVGRSSLGTDDPRYPRVFSTIIKTNEFIPIVMAEDNSPPKPNVEPESEVQEQTAEESDVTSRDAAETTDA